jgi:hypothetical protein
MTTKCRVIVFMVATATFWRCVDALRDRIFQLPKHLSRTLLNPATPTKGRSSEISMRPSYNTSLTQSLFRQYLAPFLHNERAQSTENATPGLYCNTGKPGV